MKRNRKDPIARALRDLMIPIYLSSNLMRDRSFKALNNPASTPHRTYDKYCAVFAEEAALDALDYFTAPENKLVMENEFIGDLCSSDWGVSPDVASCYLTAVRDYQNGGSTPNLRMLKHAIQSYMSQRGAKVSLAEKIGDLSQDNVISGNDISRIIAVNQFNLIKHLDIWKARRHHDISDDDIYLKRGLGLSLPFDTKSYQEERWITSYSLAVTVAEAFAHASKLSIENLFHLQYEDAIHRVLFFTPFVPGVHPNELEFGLIPFAEPRQLEILSTEGDYQEFLILP